MTWDARAACQGMDSTLFFPEGNSHPAPEAYTTCKTCPVRTQCLNEALNRLDAEDYGIWGGTSEHDRRMVRRGLMTHQQAMRRGNNRTLRNRCNTCGTVTRRPDHCARCQPANRKPHQPAGPCTVTGCTNDGRARGYCDSHYDRWRRHGNTYPDIPLTRNGRPRNLDQARTA